MVSRKELIAESVDWPAALGAGTIGILNFIAKAIVILPKLFDIPLHPDTYHAT